MGRDRVMVAIKLSCQLLPLLCWAASASLDFDTVGQFDVGTQHKPDSTLQPWHIHVWSPTNASWSETAASVVFVSGFSGYMASTSYNEVLAGVAASGYTVFGLDRAFQLG